MQRMRGLLHETSIDTSHQSLQSARDSSSAEIPGQKRSRSINDVEPVRQLSAAHGNTVTFQRASSLPAQQQAQLFPSKIVDLKDDAGLSEYSQRRTIAATPTAARDPELRLGHPTYGLPHQLVQNLESLGIREIYPWQKTCLKGPGLLHGQRNLVYCAPTGGGKSLVADREALFEAIS